MAEEEKQAKEEPTPAPEPTNTSATDSKSSNTKSKWPIVVIGLLVLLLIPLGGYFFYTQFGPKTAEPTPTPTPMTTGEKTPTPKPTGKAELDKTYTSSEHGWQIDYPSNLKLTKYGPEQIGKSGVGETVNFSYVGPTQKEGTEFYDGISITVGVKERTNGQTLEDFADNDTDIDPEIGSKTPMKEITINGLSGFETTVSGLGKVRSIYLQHPKNSNQAYYISIFAEGPGESGAEYMKTVEKMLEGFRDVL